MGNPFVLRNFDFRVTISRNDGLAEFETYSTQAYDADEAVDECIEHYENRYYRVHQVQNAQTLAPLWTAKGIDP